MANEQNLDPIRSKKVARERQLLSAKKRSENAKQEKIFQKAIAERMGFDDFNEMIDNLIKRAKKQDKSFEILRDTMGQKPIERVNNSVNITNPFENMSTEELRETLGKLEK